MSNYYFVPLGQGYMTDPRYPPQNWMAQYPPPPQPGHQHYQAVYPTTPVVQDHAQFNTLGQGVYQKVEATQPEPSSTDQQIQQYAQQLHQHSALSAHSNTHIPQHQQNQLSFQQSPFQPASTSQTSSQQGTPDLTQKANRLRKACDSCSARKCDESGPPCRACIALDIPCTFERPSRRRGPPNRHAEALKRRRLDDSDTLSDYPPQSPPASPTHAAQALAALSSQTSNQQLSAESICSVETLDALLDEFFTYIHPLYPFPHGPSFREAWKRREDLSNRSFLALLSSMVAALVSSFPQKRRLNLIGQTTFDSNPGHTKLANRSRNICIEARGPGYLSNDGLSVYDAATSFFLGLTGLYTSRHRQAKLYFSESLTIIQTLGVRQVDHASGVMRSSIEDDQERRCDRITLEMSRRIYSALHVITTANSHIGLAFPEMTKRTTGTGDYSELPADVKDYHVFPTRLASPHPGDVSPMTGFNANDSICRIYNAGHRQRVHSFAITNVDLKQHQRALYGALKTCKDILNAQPPAFHTFVSDAQPKIASQSTASHAAIGSGFGNHIALHDRGPVQYEISRANLYASVLSLRTDFVVHCMTDIDRQVQSGLALRPSDRGSTFSELNPAGLNDLIEGPMSPDLTPLKMAIQQEEASIVRELVEVCASLVEVNGEPNADNFVMKMRTIATTLIGRPDHQKSRTFLDVEANLSAFVNEITALESVDSADGSSDHGTYGSLHDRWQALRYHQTKLAQWIQSLNQP